MFSNAQQMTTYLQMVRTETNQIVSLLESEFKTLYLDKQGSSDEVILEKFESYARQCQIFLFGQLDYQSAIEELQKLNSSKGVCAKTLSYGDVAWKCETCEKDPTCIICQECFEKGDHKGHKIWLKRNVSGCCDCGDPDAWEKEGFCKDHQGYSSEALLEQLPHYIKNSAPYVFNTLVKHLQIACLQLTQPYNPDKDSPEGTLASKKQKYFQLIKQMFEFIDKLIDSCAAFIHYLTEAFHIFHFLELDEENSHQCCLRCFINEEDKNIYSKSKRKQSEDKKVCTCTPLDATFQINHLMPKPVKKLQYEFFFKMFQSFKFKQMLGLAYISNIEVLYLERNQDNKGLHSIGVQILTIDDIALMIAKDSQLREKMVEFFGILVDKVKENQQDPIRINNLLFYCHDIKYMCKPDALRYLLEKTHFLESLLSNLPKLYFLDAIEPRTEHIVFDSTLNHEALYQLEIEVIKIFKVIIKEMDYTNVDRNKHLMKAFLTFFQEINDELQKQILPFRKGYFLILLHRIFSFYFDRLILKNYLLKTQSEVQTKRPVQIMQDIMKKYVDIPYGANTHDFIQKQIEIILQPLTLSWAFTHEILANMWVMSGLFILNVPNFFYQIFEYFLLLDMSLFQLLICVSPHPNKTIQTILDNQTVHKGLDVLYTQFQSMSVQVEELKKGSNHFESRKLKTQLQWCLRFFIQLSITEISYIYPLKSNQKLLKHEYEQKLKAPVDKMFRQEMRREIVHNLIKNGGRADIKAIKDSSKAIYSQSEIFDSVLLEVTSQSKDAKGKMQFKLIEDKYLAWFDPYYYLLPEYQAKVQEVVNSIYSNSKTLNSIVGDYKSHYIYQSPVNQIVQEALASSSLISVILYPLIAWINKTSNEATKQLIDDQIGHECLKLLILILQNTKHLNFTTKHQISQTLMQNNGEIINTFLNQLGKETELDAIYREILELIYNLDSAEFNFIGERLNIKKTEEEKEVAKTSSQTDSSLSKSALKEAQRKKREEILKSYQAKRQQYIQQNTNHSEQSQAKIVTKQHHHQMEEETECSLCKETLIIEHFYNDPYGQFAYVSKSKLMYYAVKQTVQMSKQQLQNQEYIQHNGEQEEEKGSADQNNLDEVNNVDLSYLNEDSKSGAVFVKCRHYAHFKCLNSYLVAQQTDFKKRDLRKQLGLDLETFQCPLCKHVANVILPVDSLSHYEQVKHQLKENEKVELLNFFITFFSQVTKKQNNKINQTLLVDIQKYPKTFLQGIENFFVHRFQLIDLKGTSSFLSMQDKLPGMHSFATVFIQLKNLMNVIYTDTHFPMVVGKEEQESSSTTFKQICNERLRIVMDQLHSEDTHLFEQDLSILALRAIFYISLIHDESQEQFQKQVEAIQQIYKIVQAQALIRLAFLKHNGKLKGTEEEIRGHLAVESLVKLEKDPQVHDQYVQSQLHFLRKITCFVLMVFSTHKEDAKLQKESEEFCSNLANIQDDLQEFEFMTSFLSLDTKTDHIFEEPKEEEKMEDSSLVSPNQHPSNEIVYPNLVTELASYQAILVTREGSWSQSNLLVQMPDQLRLMTTYYNFHLINLPYDYQTFVQEYYKQKCKNCNKQAKENVVCLLCGETLCWLSECCRGMPDQRMNEGELTYHTRLCEASCSMFISTANGQIIMIDGDRSVGRQSPYMNKFGETFNKNSKKWENFYIDEETGGKQAFEELRKLYMNFGVANEVVKERGMKDAIYRLRVL